MFIKAYAKVSINKGRENLFEPFKKGLTLLALVFFWR